MKIFTKVFLATVLLTVYVTGYSANRAAVCGEGVYIPKNSSATAESATVWSEKADAGFTSDSFLSEFNLAALSKGISKTLNAPKRFAYSFTASSSKTSTLGMNMINTTTTQGWDEGRVKPSLSAFPNPSRGVIVVKLEQPGNDMYKITFSNTIGRLLKTIKVPNAARDAEIKVDLSDLPAGVYFYSLLVNDKMVETKRLIIQ